MLDWGLPGQGLALRGPAFRAPCYVKASDTYQPLAPDSFLSSLVVASLLGEDGTIATTSQVFPGPTNANTWQLVLDWCRQDGLVLASWQAVREGMDTFKYRDLRAQAIRHPAVVTLERLSLHFHTGMRFSVPMGCLSLSSCILLPIVPEGPEARMLPIQWGVALEPVLLDFGPPGAVVIVASSEWTCDADGLKVVENDFTREQSRIAREFLKTACRELKRLLLSQDLSRARVPSIASQAWTSWLEQFETSM